MLENMNKINEENYYEYAKNYSEGNSFLEKILILLWKNNIKTIGCCAGHLEENKKAYIGIFIDDDNIDKILVLLSNLDASKINISVTVSESGISSVKLTSSSDLFEYLLEFILNLNKLKKQDDLFKSYKKIVQFMLSKKIKYMCLKLEYKENYQAKIITSDLNIKSIFDVIYPSVLVGKWGGKGYLSGSDIYQHKIGKLDNTFFNLLTACDNNQIKDKIDID